MANALRHRIGSLAILGLLLLSLPPIQAKSRPSRFQHQQRAIEIRQNNGGILPISIPGNGADTDTSSRAATPSSPAVAPSTTSSLPAIIEITVSTSASPPPLAPASSVTTATTDPATSASTTAARASSVKAVTSQETIGNSVVNVTRTSTIDGASASISASAAAASTSANTEGNKGIGKGTLIAIIVVASSCAGVFILWTVFRRWKLKPTRQFEERLQPIDFGPGEKGAYAPMPSQSNLSRSGSMGSQESGPEKSLRRQDSLGSAAGSHRGGASSQWGGSQRGGGIAASESGASRFGGTTYPPTSVTSWTGYPQHPSPSPPRLANPYGNDYGATHSLARADTMQSNRFGEAYGRY